MNEAQRAELQDMADGVMDIVAKVATRRLVLAMEAIHDMEIEPLRKALRGLVFAARTSGGTAGRDEGLCRACDEAERVLGPHTAGQVTNEGGE